MALLVQPMETPNQPDAFVVGDDEACVLGFGGTHGDTLFSVVGDAQGGYVEQLQILDPVDTVCLDDAEYAVALDQATAVVRRITPEAPTTRFRTPLQDDRLGHWVISLHTLDPQ
jgi:hypothetical protein